MRAGERDQSANAQQLVVGDYDGDDVDCASLFVRVTSVRRSDPSRTVVRSVGEGQARP